VHLKARFLCDDIMFFNLLMSSCKNFQMEMNFSVYKFSLGCNYVVKDYQPITSLTGFVPGLQYLFVFIFTWVLWLAHSCTYGNQEVLSKQQVSSKRHYPV